MFKIMSTAASLAHATIELNRHDFETKVLVS